MANDIADIEQGMSNISIRDSNQNEITIQDLNNSESKIYKDTIKKQNKFISERFKTIKTNRHLDDKMGCIEEKETIAKHLNNGSAQNLIQSFFNYKNKKCAICNRDKTDIQKKNY